MRVKQILLSAMLFQGVVVWGFQTKLDKALILDRLTPETITRLKTNGYPGVELRDAKVSLDEARQARALAKREAITIHAFLAGWFSFEVPEKYEAELIRAKQAIRLTAAYGAPVMLMVPSGGWKDDVRLPPWRELEYTFNPDTLRVSAVAKGDNTLYAGYIARQNTATEAAIRAMKALLPLAQQEGVILAIENVGNRYWSKPDFARALVRYFKSPFVKYYFDLGNQLNVGPVEPWLTTLKDEIVRLHIKDNVLDSSRPYGQRAVPIGKGALDFVSIRRTIEEIGYNGWVTIESGGWTDAEHSAIMDRFFAGELTSPRGLADYTFVISNAGLAPHQQFVLDDVQLILSRALGKTLPVVPYSKAPKAKRIYVNRFPSWYTAADLTGKDAAVAIRGEDVWLFGRGENGFRYAAYDFLEQDLGYRFFDARGGMRVPNLFAYTPKTGVRIVHFSFPNRKVSASYLNGRDGALFLFRAGQNNQMAWYLARMGVGKNLAIDDYCTPWPFCHGLAEYLPKSLSVANIDYVREVIGCDLAKTHPEYFSMDSKGNRNPEHQPCLSNPEVRKMLRQNYFGRFARISEPSYLDISAGDTPGRFCHCPHCRALEAKYGTTGGPLLDLILEMAPEIASRWPEHKILMLAYRKQQTEKPPQNVTRMPDNFTPDFAPIDDDFSKDWTHPNNAETLANLRQWGKLAKDVMIWYYPNPYGEAITPPLGNVKRLYTDVKLMKEAGATDMFFEHNVGVREMTGFTELQSYLLSRLFRDVTLDPNVLIQEFLDFEYGPVASQVKQYLDELETLTAATANVFHWDAALRDFDFLTPERMAKWGASFDQMEKKLAGDFRRCRNIRRLRLSLDYAAFRKAKCIALAPRIRAELNEVVEDCFGSAFRYDAKKFVSKIDKNLAFLEKCLGPNAKPLPQEVFGRVPAANLTIALPLAPPANYGGMVDDPAAAYGSAAWVDDRKTGAKIMHLPLQAHIETYKPRPTYHARIGAGVTKENIGPKGQYKFYDMGTTTLTPDLHVEFGAWGFRSRGISEAYKEGCFNKARIFASFRFQGPAFYPGDKDPNKIFCDRIVVIRDWDDSLAR